MEKYRVNYSGLRSLIRNPTISAGAKAILVDLLLYGGVGGRSFPSQETLGKNHGITPRQIRNRLNELYDQGFVKKKRSGYSTSNNYYFSKEIYFLIDTTDGNFSSSQSGNTFPSQIGNKLPTTVFSEKSPINSSQILQQFEKANKTPISEVEKRKFENLCKLCSTSLVEDAIKTAVFRGKTFINTAYLSKILEEWKTTGKVPPKPIFQPCGKNGCSDGHIFNQDRQTYTECDCQSKNKIELAIWVKEWGGSN